MNERQLPPQPANARPLLGPLLRHAVDFVVVGGQAGILHGANYPTFDLDVAYARGHENVIRLVAALREIGVRLRGGPPDLPFQLDERAIENGANFTFVTKYGDFDVLADVGGIKSYKDLKAAAEIKMLDGLSVPVASIDHLIAMKSAANRTKDKLMLEEYIAIADERQRAGPDQSS